MQWEGRAGDAESDGMDNEGLCLDVPEVSVSRIIDRSAEIGGPGGKARKTGAGTPKSKFNKYMINENGNNYL